MRSVRQLCLIVSSGPLWLSTWFPSIGKVSSKILVNKILASFDPLNHLTPYWNIIHTAFFIYCSLMQVSHLTNGSHQCNLLKQDKREYNFQVLLRCASICHIFFFFLPCYSCGLFLWREQSIFFCGLLGWVDHLFWGSDKVSYMYLPMKAGISPISTN